MCPTDLASAQGAKVKQDVVCIAHWRGPTIRQVGSDLPVRRGRFA